MSINAAAIGSYHRLLCHSKLKICYKLSSSFINGILYSSSLSEVMLLSENFIPSSLTDQFLTLDSSFNFFITFSSSEENNVGFESGINAATNNASITKNAPKTKGGPGMSSDITSIVC